jgi:hypothetical protein
MANETNVPGSTPPASGAGATQPAQPTPASSQGVQVIRASNVEIPLTESSGSGGALIPSAELLDIRSAFFSGKALSHDQLATLVRSAEGGGGNGNCNIC